MSNRIDLGFDFLADNQSDGSFGATAKAAMRYQVNAGFRLEGGLGAADEGDGRSVNADLAAVIGRETSTKPGITTLLFGLRLPAAALVSSASGGYPHRRRQSASSSGCHRIKRAHLRQR